MKVWVKLLVGAALGTVLALLLPETGYLPALEALALRIGRYAAIPLIFFSLVIGIYELREDRRFWPLLGKAVLVLIVLQILVIVLGLGITMIFPPERIPILVEADAENTVLDIFSSIMEVFPSNMFAVFTGEGLFLLPYCVFAYFLAMGLSFDRNYSKPLIALFDSLSRVFYRVAEFFTEILGLFVIALAAAQTVRYRALLSQSGYLGLVVLLVSLSAGIGFIALPAILYISGGKEKKHPWKACYGSLGSSLAAFVSGDISFSLPTMIRVSKENLGVRRRAGSVCIPFFTTFGRAGSAMIAAVSFLVIIKSYSSLPISNAVIFTTAARAFLISLLLAPHGGGAAYFALTYLCLEYGHGFESGYLILKPLSFLLASCGALLDAQFCAFASCFTARTEGLQEDQELKHFV